MHELDADTLKRLTELGVQERIRQIEAERASILATFPDLADEPHQEQPRPVKKSAKVKQQPARLHWTKRTENAAKLRAVIQKMAAARRKLTNSISAEQRARLEARARRHVDRL